MPYQVVVGPKEVAAGTLAVRLRSGEQLAPLSVSDFLARVDRVVRAHAAEL
ncbi:Uncharacterised protein [Mycobacteroides abscessus subsp. abscessus]|nr:Uncharacterised protein [Mycobacteroides abscessus subsp. abscessus]